MNVDKQEDFFFEIKKHDSFTKLTPEKKLEINTLIMTTVNEAKLGKWFIDIKELAIFDKPFAVGSFSKVYDCKWRGLDIAIKSPITNRLDNILDFLKEIQLWSTLRHPNLVQFIGLSISDDNVFILMEKINGKNLKDYLNEKTLSQNMTKRKDIITQLIYVFKFLHNCNPPIIYRDLKPENILIDKYNKIKLTDFGLSKYYQTSEEGTYEMTGNTGTLRYMPPEVFLNRKYDLSVDIYSLGLIMYYLITSEQPFLHNKAENMTTYFEMDDIVFSTQKVKNKVLRTIINKCIDKTPANRFNINDLYEYWALHSTRKEYCLIS